jgi:tetratricopeptide (TPR) repeat protein
MDQYSQLADRMTSNKSGPSWQVQYGLGRSALHLGNQEMGLAALQEAAAKQPENTIILHGLAEAYQYARLPENATDAAQTALKLAPRDVQNILWYAHFRSENGQPDEAVKALKEALVLDPDRPELKIWLAKSFIASGDTQAAEKQLSAMIIESSPNSHDLEQVAGMGVQLNNLDLAIKALEKAKGLNSSFNPGLVMNLAMAYATQGQRRKALETLSAPESALIQNPTVAILKADLLDTLGQHQIALNTLNLIEETAPAKLTLPDQPADSVTKSPLLYAIDFSLPSYYVRLGQLYLALGASADAETYFERALTVNPADHKARLALMECHTLHLDLDKALNTANADWTKLKPQDANDLACLQTEINLYQGQITLAETALKNVPAETTSNPQVLALRSRIEALAGNQDRARELLDLALDTFQDNFDPMPSSSAKDALRKLMNLTAIAEAALAVKDLPLAVDLYSRVTNQELNHPLLAWRYSVALMQAAEAERLAEALSITTHAPGLSMVSDANHTQFTNCLETLAPALSQEEWLCLKARGLAAFEGEWQFELNIEPCLNNPESAAAVILSSHDELTVRRTLEAYPDNTQVLQAFGVYALKHGKADGIQAAQKALELDPANPVNHALLAFLNREEPEQALNSIKTALQFWPDEAEWHALAADLELQVGFAESASEHIAYALESDPDNAKFWQKSAEINLKQNDLEHARGDLEKSIAYQSADVAAWMQLADVNRRMGDVSEAIDNVKKAEELEPDNKSIAIKEAQLLLDQKEYTGAAKKAVAILEQDKNNDDARIILAQAHARQGQFDQALSMLKTESHGKAENPRLSLEAIKIKKEFEGAETVLPELVSLANANPENPEVLTYLTDLMIQTNRLEEAQITAQTILRILPEEAEVHLMLGRLQRKNGQLDQAIAHLSDAIAYEPGLVEAYIELGKTYQDRRNLEEAINIFKKGAEADPTDHRPYYYAGLALKECKDYTGAEEMLQQAKHNAPNDPDIIRQLGVITAMNLINHLRKSS